jgi:dihydroneopterin aldolase
MGGDRIHLEGMIFYGFHGVDPAEKVLGQRFIVDVTVERDLRKPGRTDSVSDTVSYATIFKLTRAVVEGPSRDLIEAVAEGVAEAIGRAYPDLEAVRVRVRKPGAPVKGSIFDWASVEIERIPRVDYP